MDAFIVSNNIKSISRVNTTTDDSINLHASNFHFVKPNFSRFNFNVSKIAQRLNSQNICGISNSTDET